MKRCVYRCKCGCIDAIVCIGVYRDVKVCTGAKGSVKVGIQVKRWVCVYAVTRPLCLL